MYTILEVILITKFTDSTGSNAMNWSHWCILTVLGFTACSITALQLALKNSLPKTQLCPHLGDLPSQLHLTMWMSTGLQILHASFTKLGLIGSGS